MNFPESIFKATTPAHDNYEKNHRRYRETVFAFNCQLKKLNREFLYLSSDYRFTGKRISNIFLIQQVHGENVSDLRAGVRIPVDPTDFVLVIV
jgi:hypothetical protein